MLEIDVKKMAPDSVIFVETLNTVYQITKVVSRTARTVVVKVVCARDEQPDYMLEGFQTEFSGMSNGRLLTLLDGVLKVYRQEMNMGFAFEAHPRTGRTHRLTSCVLRISDEFVPPLDGLDVKLSEFVAETLNDLKPIDADRTEPSKIDRG